MILYIEDRKKEVKIKLEHQKVQQVLHQKCESYLDQLCRYHGSTYEGRKNAACSFLHIRQKAPIMISDTVVLFPSAASDETKEVWVNYCRIAQINAFAEQTKVIFHDGSEIMLALPYRSILKQVRRCFHYLYALNLHTNEELLHRLMS